MSNKSPTIIAIAALCVAASIILSSTAAAADRITLSETAELTDSSVPGQQTNPSSIIYGGLLYLFWASNSAEAPIGADYDITYSAYDGDSWTQNTVLTANDTGNDHTPQPVLFGGELYLFWSTTNPAVAGGTDADIAVSSFDGTSWSAPVSVTSDFNSTGDYDPCPAVFGDKMYVFFEWYSPASGHYEIGCAVLDTVWQQPYAITENSAGHNLNPTASAAGNSLVLAWQSSSPDLAGSADRAIVSRTLNGEFWSGFSVVSGSAGPSNVDPCIVTFSGAAWLFWSSNSTELTSGSDHDIVARQFVSESWSDSVVEIAAGQDSGDDTGTSATVHGGKLAVSWISSSPEYSPGTDTDIVLSFFDGSEWSELLDVSGDDPERNDGGGFTSRTAAMASLGDRLIIVWETNASPLLTGPVACTWLVFTGCDLSAGGFNYLWVALPLLAIAVLAAVVLLRKRR